jgi:NitT/TauT family transport system ATP-binding protein
VPAVNIEEENAVSSDSAQPAAAKKSVTLESVGMTYPTKNQSPRPALLPVTLDVVQGEFLTIVGPSGCGKSTLLKIIGGLVKPSSGTVLVNGHTVDGPSEDAGMVFQHPVLLPWLTVSENVALPLKVRGVRRAARTARAHDLLQLVGLHDYRDQYPSELSGGMQQRVGIARALAHEPDMLLMDEPFGALDAMTRDQMTLQLLRIWDEFKKTVIFVTHSIPEAVLCADRVVVMTPGPGRIADVLEIGLPRPRTLEMINTGAFGEYVASTRRLLGAENSGH